MRHRADVSRHDHHRHMVYGAERMRCTACGQVWSLRDGRLQAERWIPSTAVVDHDDGTTVGEQYRLRF